MTTALLPPVSVPGMPGAARAHLLPASIPFRFFGAALAFQALAWIALAAGAERVPSFVGGLGLPLAALHLVTLGVLCAVTIGAAAQLLPVAVKAEPGRLWPYRLVFWLLIPGSAALAHGVATGDLRTLSLGGTGAALALLVFAGILAQALRRARGPAVVVRHLWSALAALAALAGLGLALVGNVAHGYLADPVSTAAAHLAVASYGFLGLMILGFSQVLMPMFTLSRPPPIRGALRVLALAGAALGLALIGQFAVAALLGLAAAAGHLVQMARLMKGRIRKALGPSFWLVRLGWLMLPVSLLLGLGLALGQLPPWGAPLFGLVLVAGWLLSLVLGMLQRILPFLATLHAARRLGRMPKVSELTPEALFRVQAACHAGALVLTGAGIVLDLVPLVRVGALAGAAGASLFLLAAADLGLRLRDLAQGEPP